MSGGADLPGMDLIEGVMQKFASTLTDVSAKFEAVAAPVAKFVEALSPGTMQVFALAMRDLTATIGVAMLPIIQNLTTGLHSAANLLLPAMQAMQPIMDKLSTILVGGMLKGVQLLSHALQGLAPAGDALAAVFEVMVNAVTSAAAVMLAFKDSMGAFINSLMGGKEGATLADTLHKLKDAMQRVVIVLLQAAAAIANSFGAGGFTTSLINNLKEMQKAQAGGTGVGGALQGASMKGFEQIGKDLAIAAASAVAGGGGGAVGKSMEQFAEEAVKALEDMQKNGKTISEMFPEVTKFLKDIPTKGPEWVQVGAEKAIRAAWDWINTRGQNNPNFIPPTPQNVGRVLGEQKGFTLWDDVTQWWRGADK